MKGIHDDRHTPVRHHLADRVADGDVWRILAAAPDERREGLTEFQQTYFRAGHAHAGVLLVLSLVYYQYLAGTTIDDGLQWLTCVVLLVGSLTQSGGFFVHMAVGRPDAPSSGTLLSTIGAVLLAVALLFLAYALIVENPS